MTSFFSKPFIFVLISSFFFFLMGLCTKMIPHIPAHEVVFIRGLINGILILGYIHYILKIAPWGTHKKLLWLRGTLGTIALSFGYYALQHLPLAIAITLANLSPLFSTIFVRIFAKEQVKPLQWLCILGALGGVILTKGWSSSPLDSWAFTAGILFAMLGGSAYGTIRLIKTSEPTAIIMFYFPLVMVLAYLPTVPFTMVWPQGTDFIWLFGAGLSALGGQIFVTKGIQNAELAKIVIGKYSGILYGTFFGWFLFDEILTPQQVLGILCIVGFMILNQWVALRPSRHLPVSPKSVSTKPS